MYMFTTSIQQWVGIFKLFMPYFYKPRQFLYRQDKFFYNYVIIYDINTVYEWVTNNWITNEYE
jgi:hypothetical protein